MKEKMETKEKHIALCRTVDPVGESEQSKNRLTVFQHQVVDLQVFLCDLHATSVGILIANSCVKRNAISRSASNLSIEKSLMTGRKGSGVDREEAYKFVIASAAAIALISIFCMCIVVPSLIYSTYEMKTFVRSDFDYCQISTQAAKSELDDIKSSGFVGENGTPGPPGYFGAAGPAGEVGPVGTQGTCVCQDTEVIVQDTRGLIPAPDLSYYPKPPPTLPPLPVYQTPVPVYGQPPPSPGYGNAGK
uniref:Nematode cuticle collagen N-terminal domain-containing protein n=1 Tax=Romanomermis culicivorax TaxID=13658 RepID=A0A915L001_ROMCU